MSKSCPFCGSVNVEVGNFFSEWTVACSDCCAEGPVADSEQEAWEKWNIRKNKEAVDVVNHPTHYTKYKTEVIDITRYLPFCLGNVVKYVLRAPYKGGVEDCDKALQYLKWCCGEHVIMTPSNLDMFRDNLHKLEDELKAENSQIANAQAAVLVYVYNFVFCFPGYIDDLRVTIYMLRQLLEEKDK